MSECIGRHHQQGLPRSAYVPSLPSLKERRVLRLCLNVKPKCLYELRACDSVKPDALPAMVPDTRVAKPRLL